MAINRTGAFFEDPAFGQYVYGDNGVGTLTVNGGSQLDLAASDAEDSGYLGVGIGASGNGTVSIAGGSSRLRMTSSGAGNELGGHLGRDGGTGTMSITAGGRFEIIDNDTTPIPSSGFDGSEHFSIGRNAGSTGNLSVNNGTFSIIGGAPNLSIGRDGGTGTATFSNGGLLSMESVTSSPDLDNGGDLILNVGRGGNGTLTFDDSTGFLTCEPTLLASETGFQIGRDGGTGVMNLLNGSTFTAEGGYWGAYAVVGRGLGGGGTLNVNASTLTLDGTPGSGPDADATMDIGRDSGTGVVNITNNSVVSLLADNYAHIQVGRAGGNGTLVIDDSTVNLDSSAAGAGMHIGSDGSGPGEGLVIIRNGSSVTFDGENAYLNVARQAGASGELQVLSGATLTLVNATPFEAGIQVGTEAGATKAEILVSGAGSRINASDAWMGVGVDPFDGSPDTGNGLVTIDAGGTIHVRDAAIGRGGTLVGGDGVLIMESNNLDVVNGTLRLLSGDVFEIRAGANYTDDNLLYVEGDSVLDFQIAANGSSSGRIFLNGGDAFIDANVNVAITPLGGYQFAAGQTYTLGIADAGSNLFVDPSFQAGNVSVAGQSAGFGHLLGVTGQSLIFRALNNGNGSGNAGLAFDPASGIGAQFIYDTVTETGAGAGGNFDGGVVGRNVDSISGTAAADEFTVFGNRGLTLNGLGGNDTLQGGAGNDTLIGGAGNDVMNGGPGIDTVDYSAEGGDTGIVVNLLGNGSQGGLAADTAIDSFGDTDTVTSVANVIGTQFSDSIFGGNNANNLSGGAGDDLLSGGDAGDVLNGGAGSDTADYAASNAGVAVSLLTGFVAGGHAAGDTFVSIENLTGSAFNDTLVGNNASNILTGLAGNDALNGQGGSDTASYAESNAGVAVSLLTGFVAGGHAAGDTFVSIENLAGSAFNDTLVGNNASNVLQGMAGADALNGQGGSDTASYAESNAGVSVSLLTGSVAGGHAAGDTFSSIENLTGSAFNDALAGDNVSNVLTGSGGDDLLRGRAGGDTLDGGAGADTAGYADSNAGVAVSLLTGFAAGGHAAGDTFSSIENLTGSTFKDTLVGNNSANVLTGLAGNDALNGQGGSDTASYADSNAGVAVSLLTGFAAGGHAAGDTFSSIENLTGSAFNDTLVGNNASNVLQGMAGADALNGQGGSDTASYADSNAGVAVSLLTGFVAGGHAAGDTFSSIENLAGSSFNDTLVGNNSANLLQGLAGADALNGQGGSDTASYAESNAGVAVSLLSGFVAGGHAAGDTFVSIENLAGSSFNDTLVGNNAANLLQGLAGADALNGQGGSDTASYGDSNAGVAVSLLTGFAAGGHAAGDTFVSIESLAGSSFNDTLVGNNSANFLTGLAGNDTLRGYGGVDRFVFGNGFGQDTIVDWVNGELFDFTSSTQVNAFGDLTIGSSGGNAVITDGLGNQIVVTGGAGLVDAGDFVF